MNTEIHPNYKEITVSCSCGTSFQTKSSLARDLTIEVCSQCHPFYTGKQKILDAGGRVQRFNSKFTRGRGTEKNRGDAEANSSH